MIQVVVHIHKDLQTLRISTSIEQHFIYVSRLQLWPQRAQCAPTPAAALQQAGRQGAAHIRARWLGEFSDPDLVEQREPSPLQPVLLCVDTSGASDTLSFCGNAVLSNLGTALLALIECLSPSPHPPFPSPFCTTRLPKPPSLPQLTPPPPPPPPPPPLSVCAPGEVGGGDSRSQLYM